eukprot:5909360-Karenia_brevis.AAC.1
MSEPYHNHAHAKTELCHPCNEWVRIVAEMLPVDSEVWSHWRLLQSNMPHCRRKPGRHQAALQF